MILSWLATLGRLKLQLLYCSVYGGLLCSLMFGHMFGAVLFINVLKTVLLLPLVYYSHCLHPLNVLASTAWTLSLVCLW